MILVLGLLLLLSGTGGNLGASTSPFADRLRAVDPNSIEQLELRLARGDSGTFYCMGMGGRRESSTSLKVFGDLTACRSSGSTSGASYTLLLYALLGVGLTLGLVGLGMAWRLRQMAFSEPTRTIPEYGEIIPSPPALPPSPPTKAPPVNPETQSPWKEKPEKREDSDVEQNLLYADLDHIPHRNPKWLHSKVPKETATIYAVMV
ncbi:megakaryocyte and platelet inhibitory receptor G6b [Gracilinanus agilis]|uniref:megakaryocyte and platelet inhibitory receptor G6b n=1 Tax=Gracilinanus agilis TaxID=191870 RepID=UPI001CFF52CD|nr:megakaryocyte and platelet inhibitory receptor G6b [Gracilinanus agilis]